MTVAAGIPSFSTDCLACLPGDELPGYFIHRIFSFVGECNNLLHRFTTKTASTHPLQKVKYFVF